jgi:RNA polymerase sigma-70 factor (ECF subfamily)
MFSVKEGELDKLGLLFERYRKVLYSFFYFDEDLSEDLVQNVFIRILKYRHTFKGHGEFRMWMFHIARNVNHEHYRYNAKLGKRVEMNSHFERLPDNGNDSRGQDRETDLQLLGLAISKLDHDKQEIITLSKIDGMKYKDIAGLLNCTESAVKIRVFRALKELRVIFKKIKSSHG